MPSPPPSLMQGSQPNSPVSPSKNDEKAQSVSNAIDEEIKRELVRRKEAYQREVKVMLLGQAESGKSTLQKQFQLYYASQTLDDERPSWRSVVYFNVLKAVRMILDELDYEFTALSGSKDSTDATGPMSPRSPSLTTEFESLRDVWEDEIGQLRTKLLPLITIEETLASELSGGVSVSGGRTGAYVRSGWQALVIPTWTISRSDTRRKSRIPEVVNLAGKTLGASLESIKALWRHRSVKQLMDLRKLRLNESAPFFLENIDRIGEPDYLPTNADILNVRLQTLGVMEHTFPIDMGGLTYDWKLYDVGGARGQRHAWVPYFDDATAIIFLAPISAFDQYLEEDPKTNRINDSLQLFTAICSNKLLKDAQIVLLLNKADLLKQKLKAGVKVRKYITSYGDRPNTYESVSEYFRTHFMQVHRRKDVSSSARSIYAHFTSMLDIKATHSIIANVGEVILHKHVSQIGLV